MSSAFELSARLNKLVSRGVLLLLFGYSTLDGVPHSLRKGRIERFDRREKRIARILRWRNLASHNTCEEARPSG